MYYQAVIKEIDSTVNPRWVEGFMRLQYSTLGHLDRADFAREIKLFKQTQKEEGSSDELWESNAKSYGL